jgi:hypothetical protein
MPGPAVTVPNRPFSTETISGLMLPDGVFESSLGHQVLNAQFRNLGAASVVNAQIFVEATSDPSVIITPNTFAINTISASSSVLLNWGIDVTSAQPGIYLVSFIISTPGGSTRVIKKIFVTKVQFNPATKTFSVQAPEGRFEIGFRDFIAPKNQCCPNKTDNGGKGSFLSDLSGLAVGPDTPFALCLPGYLPHLVDGTLTRTPPFPGQYGHYPYQDFAWKILFCILAAIFAAAAAITCAIKKDCDLTVTTGPGGGGGGGTTPDCCGIQAQGGGTDGLAAFFIGAAGAAATAAALSDGPDPIRRGEDNTVPAAGELTTQEKLTLEFSYPDPVAVGQPFAIGLKWAYTRVTTGASYTYSANDTKTNQHVVTKYDITAPNVIRRYKREPFIVQAKFFGPDDQLFSGDDLFVQCLLAGPNGQRRHFLMEDNGVAPDTTSNDGIYTGIYHFEREEQPNPDGLWKFFVVAQDINTAQPDMTPEDQAKIVGGMLLTHQLTITIGGGTCPFVPDGDVNVIG